MTDRDDITPEEALARTQVRIKDRRARSSYRRRLEASEGPQGARTGQERNNQRHLPRVGPLWSHR